MDFILLELTYDADADDDEVASVDSRGFFRWKLLSLIEEEEDNDVVGEK